MDAGPLMYSALLFAVSALIGMGLIGLIEMLRDRERLRLGLATWIGIMVLIAISHITFCP